MARMFYKNANCMGYAFAKNKWLIPHGWYNGGMEDAKDFVLSHFKYRVKFYKEYKKIHGQQMIQELPLGKTFIVLRGEHQFNEDFHFVKRLPSGHWRHKPGTKVIEPITAKWVAQSEWPFIFKLTYGSSYYVFESLE
jgi:hypothetical protein